ncbi:MAG: NAD-dependent epimerase/dehydratase family protein [Sphaerochaeta sp.]
MKILIIGGTGTISSAITKLISDRGKDEVWVLNRGNGSASLAEGIHRITADAYDGDFLSKALKGMYFDTVCYFIGFTVSQVKTAYEVLKNHIGQFIYISSASVYQKPPKSWLITEETPLENPYWEYSRNKIECENFLMGKYRDESFPVTIVRPSHTYCEKSVPVGIHGVRGSWQILKRMLEGKPVIVHGDGTSLWTMTDSRDFAKAFAGLMGNPKAIGRAFHITSDESIPWNLIYTDIADALSECLGRKVNANLVHVASDRIIAEGKAFGYDLEGNLKGDKSNSVVFDNSRVKSVVPDFRAEISHKEGTLRAVKYILSHPELQIEDPDFDRFCDRLAEL